MIDVLRHYPEVWLVDTEFHQPTGERPDPICLVGREYRTGRTLRLWRDELLRKELPPFRIDREALFVAYYASAELSVFLALGWPMPTRIVDLFVEFRNLSNGLAVPAGNSLLGALAWFGLPAVDAAEKTAMRDIAIRGGPFTEDEQAALLDYCQSDVDALVRLLPAMLPHLDIPRALLRGRYMAAAAAMEWNGVPIDVDTLEALKQNWPDLKGRLVERIDGAYGVYTPAGGGIDGDTRLGAELLRVAEEYGIDPHVLSAEVETVWRERRESGGDVDAALVACRKQTGLTPARIERWENDGRDYSTWPHLDTDARELASQYACLGIGRGFVEEGGVDDTDYAAALWELLRHGRKPVLPKHDPAILKEAAERVATFGPDAKMNRFSFSTRRFADYLIRNGIPWPRLPTGSLALDDDTFRQMSRLYPVLSSLRELRHSLGEMRLFVDLAIGSDGRNRCGLSAFRSITGRNQPSNARFIFGPSTWLRSLIQPAEGRAVAYVDWSQQEFGIAAALSGDGNMMEAYSSGDPYLAFARQAKAVPPDATKKSHPRERNCFKILALAVQYGMQSFSLATALNQPEPFARELLRLHKTTYPAYWRYSEAAVNHAMLHGWLSTVFGWRVHVGPRANPRSLANFMSQANGAEMLRLACCLATERGICVCAPVHDALLVEGPADEIDTVVDRTQAAMAEASRAVLAGFELRSDAKIVRHPDRYADPRGEAMWKTTQEILAEVQPAEALVDGVPF